MTSTNTFDEREQSVEKHWALKRDQEALEKLRRELAKHEAKIVDTHGASALPVNPAASAQPDACPASLSSSLVSSQSAVCF
jgi:hypothetical protein